MMQISTAKKVSLQPELFGGFGYEERLCTVAACRNYAGDFCEEATAVLTGGTRLQTDSRKDICPDIQLAPNVFLESKSIGYTRAIIIYLCRLTKDLAFMEQGNDLTYVLWHHKTRVFDDIRLGDLRDSMASSLQSVTFVHLPTLAKHFETQPVKMLNAKHKAKGYGAYGYNEGYNARLNHFERLIPELPIKPTLEVYGRQVQVPIVRCMPEDVCKLGLCLTH